MWAVESKRAIDMNYYPYLTFQIDLKNVLSEFQ